MPCPGMCSVFPVVHFLPGPYGNQLTLFLSICSISIREYINYSLELYCFKLVENLRDGLNHSRLDFYCCSSTLSQGMIP